MSKKIKVAYRKVEQNMCAFPILIDGILESTVAIGVRKNPTFYYLRTINPDPEVYKKIEDALEKKEGKRYTIFNPRDELPDCSIDELALNASPITNLFKRRRCINTESEVPKEYLFLEIMV